MRYTLLVVFLVAASMGWSQDEGLGAAAPTPLSISLGANDETETTIFPGMPLTLVAVLENGPAVEAETARLVLEQMRASLDAVAADPAMGTEEAEAWLAGQEAPPPAPSITVRALSARFRFVGPDGAALPWTPRMLGEQDEPTVLDSTASLLVTFVVSPDETSQMPPGEVRLRLRHDGQSTPAGEWTGVAESAEVLVTVAPPPQAPTPEQAWTRAQAFCGYHLATAEWEAAMNDAQAMVQAIPTEPGGYALLAQAREGQGDQRGALQAYQAAIKHYVALDPEGEPPFGLMLEAARLRKALGVELPAPAVPAGPAEGTPRAPTAPTAPAEGTSPSRPSPTAPTGPAAPTPAGGPGPLAPQPFNSQDPNAQRQWAVDATASSQYSAAGGSARQATGRPDTPRYGDASSAWAPTPQDGGVQWLELTYRYPMAPSWVEVYETCGAGAVAKVLVLPEGAQPTEWVSVLDRRAQAVAAGAAEPLVTVAEAGAVGRPTRRVRIEVDTAVPGWNEIDAVALVGRFATDAPSASPGVFHWWAQSAAASSQYGTDRYAASQAAGPPDGPPGDRPTAWAPGDKDGGVEWLEINYPAPLVPAELSIHENCGPGGVVRLEAHEEATGRWVTLWEGKDPTTGPAGVFSPALTANSFAAQVFRVHLDTSVPGWNEIDAVELVGNPPASP